MRTIQQATVAAVVVLAAGTETFAGMIHSQGVDGEPRISHVRGEILPVGPLATLGVMEQPPEHLTSLDWSEHLYHSGSGIPLAGFSGAGNVAGANHTPPTIELTPGEGLARLLAERPPFPFTEPWSENEHRPEFLISLPPAAFPNGPPDGLPGPPDGIPGPPDGIPGPPDGVPGRPDGVPSSPGGSPPPVIANPEPASFVLFGLGAGALAAGAARRRRRNESAAASCLSVSRD